MQRRGGSRFFILAMVSMSLLALSVSVVPAVRSSNSVCQSRCNDDFTFCDDECNADLGLCQAGCDELADPKDCNAACKAAEQACHGNCGDLKNECKSACPKKKQSPEEPQ